MTDSEALEHAKGALENQIDGKNGRGYYIPYLSNSSL